MTDTIGGRGKFRPGSLALVSLALAMAVPTGSVAAADPPIRIGQNSRVPACVTPERLMQFLRTRNANLDARFKDIAGHYKRHGEAWKVRWDYAFYQMAIETNFLTYRAPSGRMGDVDPTQNNFAGIGTTGGGVPGDRYPDVSTGVLAQIQHLVVYAGERIDRPVAPRTQLKQDVILALSLPIAKTRAVTFQDLSGRWAVDKAYGRSIKWVADRYVAQFCPRGEQAAIDDGERVPPTVSTFTSVADAGVPAESALDDVDDRSQALPGRMAMAANAPKLDSKRRSRAYAEQGGKSALAGPAKAKAKPKDAADEDGGIGIARSAAPLAEGPGAEIARRAIGEQRSTAGFERQNLGVLNLDAQSVGADNLGRWSPPIALAGTSVSAVDSGASPPACRVSSASYGGTRTVIVKSGDAGRPLFTLLTVLDGFERTLTESFMASQAPGSQSLGVFDSREAAVARIDAECGPSSPR